MPEVVRLAYQGRVRYLDGDEQIAPGVQIALVGGHTPGSQVVVVSTKGGQAVLCADALHLYANWEYGVVGQPCIDVAQGFLAWDRIKALASSPDLIVPGHDPLVMRKFPLVSDGVVEIG
jgi:glyoxylase-like metal-dependent hydrolase (beta-lactamase superfamily II)